MHITLPLYNTGAAKEDYRPDCMLPHLAPVVFSQSPVALLSAAMLLISVYLLKRIKPAKKMQ
jgi:hypothetical protein